MDQCTNCTVKGDIKKCLQTRCGYHELWMVIKIKEITHFRFTDIGKHESQQPDPPKTKPLRFEIKKFLGVDFLVWDIGRCRRASTCEVAMWKLLQHPGPPTTERCEYCGSEPGGSHLTGCPNGVPNLYPSE